MSLQQSLESLGTRARFSLIALVCIFGAIIAASVFGWTEYVQTWFGALFVAASGAALGFVVSRFGAGIHLSKIPEAERWRAGLAQSVYVGALAIACGVAF